MANEMQTVKAEAAQPISNVDIRPGFYSAAAIHQLQILTKVFAKSSLVPQAYRNNESDCAIVINMASRMGADPLMMLQNVYVVYGTPALSSKMMIALFNSCGKYGSIHYKETGKKGTDTQGVVAYAKELATGDVLTGPEVTIGIAKKEGWYSKNGSKWQTMPDQMLRYRAASWFIRTTAPELTLGLQDEYEAEDIANSDVRKEIRVNANSEVFEPTKEPPTIQPAHKIPEAELKAATEPPVKTASKKAEAKAEPVQPTLAPAGDEGPGF